MDNINIEKVYAVLEYIEVNFSKEIKNVIDDYADGEVYLDFDDIDAKVEYAIILKDNLKKFELNSEEFDLVISSLIGYISKKIAARIDAKNRALVACHLKENKNYYGSFVSAYEQLYTVYLNNFGYFIYMEDIANEILESKKKIKEIK